MPRRTAGDVDHCGEAAVQDWKTSRPTVLPSPRRPTPADHADDRGACGLPELDRRAADATGGGVHRRVVALRNPSAPVRREPRRLVPDAQRGGLRVVEGHRRRQHIRLFMSAYSANAPLGSAVAPTTRSATTAPSGTGSDRDDLAAELDARSERQWRLDLVLAATEQHVREVGRSGRHLHQFRSLRHRRWRWPYGSEHRCARRSGCRLRPCSRGCPSPGA